MANPQLENGYLKLANEIVLKFANYRIPGEEWQILWAILIRTYGWNKKTERISLPQFQEYTGLKKPNIIRAIKNLLSKKIIVIKNDNEIRKEYGFNKHFEEWEKLSKKIIVIKNDNGVIKNDNTPPINNTKDTLIKTNNIYSRDAQKVLDYLNEKKGSKYSRKDEIIARLKEGKTIDECLLVIENKFKNGWFLEHPEYLRPTTLFAKSHFDDYLNENTMAPQKQKKESIHERLQREAKEMGLFKDE